MCKTLFFVWFSHHVILLAENGGYSGEYSGGYAGGYNNRGGGRGGWGYRGEFTLNFFLFRKIFNDLKSNTYICQIYLNAFCL